jgi:hypothetical protein
MDQNINTNTEQITGRQQQRSIKSTGNNARYQINGNVKQPTTYTTMQR